MNVPQLELFRIDDDGSGSLAYNWFQSLNRVSGAIASEPRTELPCRAERS